MSTSYYSNPINSKYKNMIYISEIAHSPKKSAAVLFVWLKASKPDKSHNDYSNVFHENNNSVFKL
jgi:hypothetical protein